MSAAESMRRENPGLIIIVDYNGATTVEVVFNNLSM
jgi:hypothetical protein